MMQYTIRYQKATPGWQAKYLLLREGVEVAADSGDRTPKEVRRRFIRRMLELGVLLTTSWQKVDDETWVASATNVDPTKYQGQAISVTSISPPRLERWWQTIERWGGVCDPDPMKVSRCIIDGSEYFAVLSDPQGSSSSFAVTYTLKVVRG
jgi:hypothetical protein